MTLSMCCCPGNAAANRRECISPCSDTLGSAPRQAPPAPAGYPGRLPPSPVAAIPPGADCLPPPLLPPRPLPRRLRDGGVADGAPGGDMGGHFEIWAAAPSL